MADNPYVNKVVYDGDTLIDLTSDTVTADTLAQGVTAHNAAGALITGTMSATSDYDQLSNRPSINSVTLTGNKTSADLGFATVATSGSYDDLTDKPTIPAAGIPSGGTSGQVLGKSSNTDYAVGWVSTVTGVKGDSESTYRTGNVNITCSDIWAAPSNHATSTTGHGAGTANLYGHVKLSDSATSDDDVTDATAATPLAVKTAYDLADGKQDALISGTNIKTINNESLLGSGNITIQGGSITPADTNWAYLAGSSTSSNYCRWRCKSGIVFVEVNYASGAAVPTVSSGFKTFGTVPSGYRPTKGVTTLGYSGTNNINCYWIETSGAVKGSTRASASQSAFYGFLSYPLD